MAGLTHQGALGQSGPLLYLHQPTHSHSTLYAHSTAYMTASLSAQRPVCLYWIILPCFRLLCGNLIKVINHNISVLVNVVTPLLVATAAIWGGVKGGDAIFLVSTVTKMHLYLYLIHPTGVLVSIFIDWGLWRGNTAGAEQKNRKCYDGLNGICFYVIMCWISIDKPIKRISGKEKPLSCLMIPALFFFL